MAREWCGWLSHYSPVCISYKNQLFNLLCKSNDWFLNEMQHWTGMGSGIIPGVRKFAFKSQPSSGFFDWIKSRNSLFSVDKDLMYQFLMSKTVLSPVVHNWSSGSQVADKKWLTLLPRILGSQIFRYFMN